jgi:microsomal epoxide hydrolase
MSLATSAVRPFRIAIPDTTLADLERRLEGTRWLEQLGDGWQYGLDVAFMRELCRYWRAQFDWRLQEADLNRFDQFLARLDGGTELHFIHERGRGPEPLPLLMTHGFPDSIQRFHKLIPMLTDPVSHGADPRDAFDVIAPSLPGYAFSSRLRDAQAFFQVGDLFHELMTQHLGYERYGAHGGDWGSTVTELLGRDHGRHVVGMHLTDVPFFHAFHPPSDPSHAEKRYLEAIEHFPETQGAYALVQGSEPEVVALALGDSPMGLAGWIIEKFRRWSDCDGDVERRFTKDELLTNVTLYWATGTIGSSFLPYHAFANAGATTWLKQKLKEWTSTSRVATAFAMFPKDLCEWAERFFDVRRWTEMPRGGHFAALEEPALLAEDIRAFFRPLRSLR